jgi:hypothetical protein
MPGAAARQTRGFGSATSAGISYAATVPDAEGGDMYIGGGVLALIIIILLLIWLF